jgi:hypothetical protein
VAGKAARAANYGDVNNVTAASRPNLQDIFHFWKWPMVLLVIGVCASGSKPACLPANMPLASLSAIFHPRVMKSPDDRCLGQSSLKPVRGVHGQNSCQVLSITGNVGVGKVKQSIEYYFLSGILHYIVRNPMFSRRESSDLHYSPVRPDIRSPVDVVETSARKSREMWYPKHNSNRPPFLNDRYRQTEYLPAPT